MSLFSKANTPKHTVLANDFMRYHATASTISVESASVFLGKTKDALSSFVSLFDLSDDQKPFTDATKGKHETLALAKEVKMVDFRHRIISKPEAFKGLYVDYAQDLFESGVKVGEVVNTCNDKLKLLISTFINEYKDTQLNEVYGYLDFKTAHTKLERVKHIMKPYFSGNVNKVKANPDDVLKNMSDLSDLFARIEMISAIFSKTSLMKINRDVQDLAEMIDSLLAHNVQSKVLTNNNDAKRQLMECIQITAECVEYHSALYAQALVFCTSFKSLTDELKEMD